MSNYPVSERLEKTFNKNDLKDRFYIEELWQSLNEEFNVPFDGSGGWKSTTFLEDWLKELVKKVPVTKEDRQAYIEEQFMPEWFPTWENLIEAGVVDGEEEAEKHRTATDS